MELEPIFRTNDPGTVVIGKQYLHGRHLRWYRARAIDPISLVTGESTPLAEVWGEPVHP